ncbi:hypothetical protein DYB37_006686 [Aphanomyces astaci]|uniref:Translocation protein SEC62 n=1 Tax=Aphanomyces astaci TaxID=112090 RepID=A0A418EGC8_APHAT|nr:hypothetical protein DYB35_009609 [Aphanomyces astaci]RHZ12648.1 hypothetical protein DYB37_006686 [Aphanomyces astaci]
MSEAVLLSPSTDETAALSSYSSKETPQLLDIDTTMALADTLLHHAKCRDAIERDRRVTFFRGKEVRKCFRNANDSVEDIGHSLLAHGFIHKSRRIKAPPSTKAPTTSTYPHLDIDEADQTFTDDGVYTWMYEGSSMWRHIASLSFFGVLCMGVLYPVWPVWGQKMLWDSGVTVGLAIAAMLVVRFISWLIVWLATGNHMWVLPQFPVLRPTYTISNSKQTTTASRMYRVGVAVIVVGIALMMWHHPPACSLSAKKGCMSVGRKLVKQAYRGTLLQRFSQEEKDFAMSMLRVLRRLF